MTLQLQTTGHICWADLHFLHGQDRVFLHVSFHPTLEYVRSYAYEPMPLSYSCSMGKKLTAKTIDNLKPPAGRERIDIRDELLPGLSLRVSSSGRKVFYLIKRINGKNTRLKIGTYPLISLADAREKTRTILAEVEAGTYGSATVETQNPETLGELIPRFIELYAKPRTKDWKGTQSVLQKFAPLFHMMVHDIRRADVVRVTDDMILDDLSTRANRATAAIKKLMNWAVDRGIIDTSPLTAMKLPVKEQPRDRVLSGQRAGSRMASRRGRRLLCTQILMLTGQRRAEVSGMRWSEIDFETSTWTLPANRVKNATLHVVPLSEAVVDILPATPRFLKSDYVFTTTGQSPISGFGRAKDRIDEHAQLSEPWRLHDLRRTMATKMAELRIPPHIIEAVLNHKTGIVSGVRYLPRLRPRATRQTSHRAQIETQMNPRQAL